jgi:hypothetical protein
MFILQSGQRINLDLLVKLDQAVPGGPGCRIAMCVPSGSLSIQAVDIVNIAAVIQLLQFDSCDSSIGVLNQGRVIYVNPKNIVSIEPLPLRPGFYRIQLCNCKSEDISVSDYNVAVQNGII